ncbi:hypothetical protein MHBO_000603, partial [Bonamia ostreae]
MGQKEKYKIIFLGESGAGKTSVIRRVSTGQFVDNVQTTMGIDFQIKKVQKEDYTFLLQIWDTAGQERFKSLVSSYIRGSNIIAIVYDVTSRDSFESVEMWIEEIKKGTDKRPELWLIGNKVDVKSREVETEEGRNKAKTNKMHFIETSAKTGENIDKFLTQTIDFLYEKVGGTSKKGSKAG